MRCETCRDRIAQVSLYLAWFVLVTEHLLILLKVCLTTHDRMHCPSPPTHPLCTLTALHASRLLRQVFLMIAIPDKPLWVVRASERRRYAFEKERLFTPYVLCTPRSVHTWFGMTTV